MSETPKNVKLIHWFDLGYAAKITRDEDTATFDAYVARVVTPCSPERVGLDSIEYKCDEGFMTPDFDKADVVIHSYFRSGFDECSDSWIPDSDNNPLHFCDREGAVNFGVMLGRLYDAVKEFKEEADEDVRYQRERSHREAAKLKTYFYDDDPFDF